MTRHVIGFKDITQILRLFLMAVSLCLAPVASLSADLHEDANREKREDLITGLSSEDLELYNPLMEVIDRKIQRSGKLKYNEKIVDSIEHHLPKNAARYWLIFDFLALYYNGGMQHALLTSSDEIPFKEWQLKKTVEAFSYYKCQGLAAYLEDLIPQAVEWIKANESLLKKEDKGVSVPDVEYQKIWDQIDVHDQPFLEILQKEKVYEAVHEDIQNSPGTYTR